MGRRIIIEQDTPSASDIVIEIVSSIGGIALGAGSAMYLNTLLPAAATAMEEVVRKGTIGLGSFTIGVAGSKAIESEMEDCREAAMMAKLMASGLFSKEEIEEVTKTPVKTVKK